MKKSREELYKWFSEKFDSCYLVEHKDYNGDYFMYYDEQFIRQKKLARILDEEIVYPTKPSGKVIFYQDWKNERLWCDYNEIYSYLETNYSDNYDEIRDLIIFKLEEHDELSGLIPLQVDCNLGGSLEEHDKLNVVDLKNKIKKMV